MFYLRKNFIEELNKNEFKKFNNRLEDRICLSSNSPQMGLTGFDSGQKWYVSMQCAGGWHYNLGDQKFNWRRKLRSCCLIEV